jgi:sodium-dependent dicarboxylate transporter 2/3/5
MRPSPLAIDLLRHHSRTIAWYAAAIGSFAIVLLLPSPLGPSARLVAAISALGMVLWVSEKLPLYITALLVSFLLIVLGGFDVRTVFAAYFDPVVVLILGGFVLGVALQKHGLDRYLAAVLLRRAGTKPSRVLLGLMLLAAGFSMWMSNTASTAVVLPVAVSILALNGIRGKTSNFAKASVLGVAYAASIGGIGTLVGSTPNPLAARFLADAGEPITFAEWMYFTLPIVAVMLIGAWLVLLRLYPPEVASVRTFDVVPKLDRPKLLVMATFFLTVALWLTTGLHGIPASVVSLVPMLVLYLLRLLVEADFGKVDWGTLVLIGGSIALGEAIQASGLAETFAQAIGAAVAGQPLVLVFLIVVLAAIALTVAATNTAAAVVMIPLMIPLAPVLGVGLRPLVLMVAVGVSIDLLVPVGTPPNAMAYATGMVRVRDMIYAGSPLVVLATLLTTAVALVYW